MGRGTGGARAGGGQADQKAEPGRVTLRLPGANGRDETTTVELVRPAISAAVIALLTRKETVESVQQPFEMLADDVGDGVSVSTMVIALGDAGGGRRRGSAGVSNYTAVWVKGERLPPKPGRADDFSWPRPEALPAQTTPAAEARPAIGQPAARRANIPQAQPQLPRAPQLPAAQPGTKG